MLETMIAPPPQPRTWEVGILDGDRFALAIVKAHTAKEAEATARAQWDWIYPAATFRALPCDDLPA